MKLQDTEAPDIRGLLGLFLADGFLLRARSPTKGHIKATFHGGINELDFLEEKRQEVKQIVPTTAEISFYKTKPSSTGSQTSVLRFRFSSPLLDPVYNLFYPDGEREITRPLLDILGLRAAAWLWAESFRPDGPGGRICRVGSMQHEARLISGWLQLLTGATSSVGAPIRGRKSPYLKLSGKSVSVAKSALLPYAPQSRRHLFLPEES